MNLLRHSFAFLTVVLVSAATGALEKSDFASAKEVIRKGETLVEVTLSESGLKKIAEFNKAAVGKKIPIHVSGEEFQFVLRVPIIGKQMEMGPFSELQAQRIVTAINH